MGEGIRKSERVHEVKPTALGELIHEHVRGAIETAVVEELARALGAAPYERADGRRGYRNGQKARTLTGPTGPLALRLPRGTVFTAGGPKEWTSTIVPRYQRRMREVNEAVVGPIWRAPTPGACAAPWRPCSRRPRCPRVRCRASWRRCGRHWTPG